MGGTRIIAEPGVAGADRTSRAIVTAEARWSRPSLITRPSTASSPGPPAASIGIGWATGCETSVAGPGSMRPVTALASDWPRPGLPWPAWQPSRPSWATSPTADVTVVAGGAFATAPPAAIVLALADTIRRPGVSQLVWDHARLLGPIGTIEDPGERRTPPRRPPPGCARAARQRRGHG